MTTISIEPDTSLLKILVDAFRTEVGTTFYRSEEREGGSMNEQLVTRMDYHVHLDTTYDGEHTTEEVTVVEVLDALEQEAMIAEVFGMEPGAYLDRHGLTADDKAFLLAEIHKLEEIEED